MDSYLSIIYKGVFQMWKKLTGLGMLGVALYVLHVILGGFLWKGYNHLMQPISDLTGSGAPDKALLSIITLCYGLFCIIAVVSAFMYTRKSVPKLASAGLLVFLAMHLVSISYGFFPEDLAGAPASFAGTMHLVVTFLIIPLTILAPLLIGIGLRKDDGLKGFGLYSIITGIVIFCAGGTSAMFFAQKLPYFGLVERINIGTLQIWTFILCYRLFSSRLVFEENSWAASRKEKHVI
jgi:hypothetical membrane protein